MQVSSGSPTRLTKSPDNERDVGLEFVGHVDGARDFRGRHVVANVGCR